MANKVVVFDLDETLGCFVQFGIIQQGICDYFKKETLTQHEFNKLLDIYPDFLRPLILEITKYIYKKKKSGEYKKVCIYTNNTGPRSWTLSISKYFDYKLKIPKNDSLFDRCICAFMVNNKRLELFRTSHQKNYDDLVKCARLPQNTHVCFIDDVHHPGMEHDNVYYIYIKPYEFEYSITEIIDKYLKNPIIPVKDSNDFKHFMTNYYNNNWNYSKKTAKEQDIDTIVTKQIYKCLKDF